MFVGMGVGAYAAGIFHLYTHAFFKALLFLGSGAVIHALAGEQDIRQMGGLKDDLPITYWTFLIGSLAIAGVPLLSGFFSKDEILFRTYASGHTLLWVVGLLTSLLTAIYMFRLVFLTFHGERRVHDGPAPPPHPEEEEPAAQHVGSAAPAHAAGGHHLHDAPRPMAVALVALAIGSVLAGYAGFPGALGGSGRFERFLEPSFTTQPAPASSGAELAQGEPRGTGEDVGLELGLMAVSSLVALAGIGIAVFFFLRNRAAAERAADRFGGVRTVLLNKYYVDEVYDAGIVQPVRIISEEGLWKGVDVRVIDGTVNAVADSVGGMSELLRRLQTGSVRAYAASLFLGVVAVLGYYLWR
jgi:NADH-quinone oxidoreductase subunit L